MSNPEFHTCPDCCYKWRHGQHGGHNCRLRIKEQRDELLESLKLIEIACKVGMPEYGVDDVAEMARSAISKVEGCVEATRQS